MHNSLDEHDTMKFIKTYCQLRRSVHKVQ